MQLMYGAVCCLQKCLTTLDLTSLGVGSCVGTGMYLVSGMVARNVAGPGVVISFIIAALASVFSGNALPSSLFLMVVRISFIGENVQCPM